MKKIYNPTSNSKFILFAFLFVVIISARSLALIHVIQINDANGFNPPHGASLVGDTMKWHWTGPSDHSVVTISVPAGAAVINVTLNSSNTDYLYKVTVGGTYTYHSAMPSDTNAKFSADFTAPTGINDPGFIAALNLYPNPFSNQLNIELKNYSLFGENIRVSLINILGKEVALANRSDFNSLGKLSLNVAALPRGLYFLMIEANQNKAIYKLMKATGSL